MYRRAFLIAFGTLCWCGGLSAEPNKPRPNLFVTTSASTQPDWKVVVEATVENRGQVASDVGKLEITFKPQVSRSSRPKGSEATMADPFVEEQEIPAMEPGEKKVLTFATSYISKNSFKNARGSFKASNVDPTGSDVNVSVSTRIK
jgi:hypothetical protein